jgi:hypothetical protein
MINADDGDSSPVDLDLASSDAVACLRREVHELRQALIQRDAFKNTLATELQDMWRIPRDEHAPGRSHKPAQDARRNLDAAIALQDADSRNIQLYDSASGHNADCRAPGFTREFLDHFQSVSGKRRLGVRTGLRARARMIV